MGRKRGGTNDPRRVKGVPGRARALKDQRETEQKLVQLRAALHQLKSLQRREKGRQTSPHDPDTDDAALADERDACFRQLRVLAASRKGLVSNDLRRELWPFLLGLDGDNAAVNGPSGEADAHRDAYQVEKDIDRSLWHFDVMRGIKESERRAKRRALTQVISTTLVADSELHYFQACILMLRQGFHDICSVFLLVFGDARSAGRAMRVVSASYHREPMRDSFASVMQTTRLLFPLLDAADEQLFGHLQDSMVEPFFALPWIITWFAHQLSHFEDVARLYDVFLVSHPLFSLYVSAAVVLEARTRVLQCDCDFGTMHGLLSKLPLTMELENVVARAVTLIHQVPPADLLMHSDAKATLANAMYFQLPFALQTWPSISAPMLSSVPPLPARSNSVAAKASTRWKAAILASKSSIVVAAAGIGLLAVIAAYVWRARSAPVAWLDDT